MNRTQRALALAWISLVAIVFFFGCGASVRDVTPQGMARNFADLARGNVALHRCKVQTVLMTWADGTQSPLVLNVCRNGAAPPPPPVDGNQR
jgi:hypothetical protein